MRQVLILAGCLVAGSVMLGYGQAAAAVETYPGVVVTPSTPPHPVGIEFPWNGASPYAEMQAGGGPVLRVPAGQPRQIAYTGLVDTDITTGVLVVDGTRLEFPATVANGEIVAPAQTFSVGTHTAQAGVCNDFGCSPLLAFTVIAGTPPAGPGGVRLVQLVADGLRAIADAIERAQ